MLEKTAHYAHIFFFVFGLAPLSRYFFSTTTLSSSQTVITVVCWFALMGATVYSWEAWKRHALRSYSGRPRVDEQSDEEYIKRVCASFARLPQSKEFGEELQKMQHKDIPMLWWDELNDMVRNQSTQTNVMVDPTVDTESTNPQLPQKIHV